MQPAILRMGRDKEFFFFLVPPYAKQDFAFVRLVYFIDFSSD
jgi:hypothetical protein